jgi:hypothetical protein
MLVLLVASLLFVTPISAAHTGSSAPPAPSVGTHLTGSNGPPESGPETAATNSPPLESGPRITINATTGSGIGGDIRYTLEISNLSDVGALWVVTSGARYERPTGAQRDDSSATRLRWDGRASAVRTTLVPAGDPDADGTLRVSGRDWAFGPVPPLLVVWTPEEGGDRRTIRPFQDRDSGRVQVSTPVGGLVGKKYAVSGAVTVRTVQTDHGVIQLVTPESESPRASKYEIHDALGTAASEFDGGGSTGGGVVFVVPGARQGGATFLSADETWVAGDARLHTANSVWFHEYVHSRQEFALGPRMRWFEEASAEYFAARLAAETGYAGAVDQELYWLGRTRSESRLTDPATWSESTVPYHRGALVLAALDSEIQTRTDGQRSLEDVFRRLNQHDGVVTYELFTETVTEVTGEEMEPWVDRYVAGTGPVSGPTTSSTALTVIQTTLPAGRSDPLGLGVAITLFGGIVLRRRPFE